MVSISKWMRNRKLRKHAWAAFDMFWGVPYTEELERLELEGMYLLEREGKVTRDEGYSRREHWHAKR